MKFWDSSPVVALLIATETASAFAQRVRVADPDVVVAWFTPIEILSALGRLNRSRRIEPAVESAARLLFAELRKDWREVSPSPRFRGIAERCVAAHPLTTFDACQLAAALIACEERPPSLELVCFDGALARAAAREGFRLVTPPAA